MNKILLPDDSSPTNGGKVRQVFVEFRSDGLYIDDVKLPKDREGYFRSKAERIYTGCFC